MARGKSKSTAVNSQKWEFKGFINYTFEAKEITEMLNWFDQRTIDHAETIQLWCDEGFKVSQSYDASRNCYIFSATP